MREVLNSRIKWIEIHYTDPVGRTHTLMARKEKVLNSDLYFDGSSVGLAEINDSDLHLQPDFSTLTKIPWDSGAARLIAEVWEDGRPYWGDSRRIAGRASQYIASQGYTEKIGAELEFFLHKVRFEIGPTMQMLTITNDEYPPDGVLAPKNAYELAENYDVKYKIRSEASEYLDMMGHEVRVHHHEVAPNQYEYSTPSGSAKGVGDSLVTIKYVLRYVAKKYGYTANFMPKPIWSDNGSGMHIHLSLWVNGTNLFISEDKYGLSQIGRYFIGGILEHGKSLAALVAPTVNSYKRLLPGYEAPIYLAWGFSNRSAAVRIPKTGLKQRKRVEFRVPDPTANPYVAIAATLLAGMDGIKRKIDPGDPIKRNLYSIPPWELRELGVRKLPASLTEALEELETDHEYLETVFPKEFLELYIELKRKEVRKVTSIPTPAEFAEYVGW